MIAARACSPSAVAALFTDDEVLRTEPEVRRQVQDLCWSCPSYGWCAEQLREDLAAGAASPGVVAGVYLVTQARSPYRVVEAGVQDVTETAERLARMSRDLDTGRRLGWHDPIRPARPEPPSAAEVARLDVELARRRLQEAVDRLAEHTPEAVSA